MSSATRTVPQFRVGDWASLDYGTRRVLVQIIEDRGPIGVRGRRLYRIRLDADQGETSAFEVPEEELELAEARGGPNPLLKATLERLGVGKRFVRISLEEFARAGQKVTFHFSDGTEEELSFDCNHATFMEWWKETSVYLRSLADAFGHSTSL